MTIAHSGTTLIQKLKEFVATLDFSNPDSVISQLKFANNTMNSAPKARDISIILFEYQSFFDIPGDLNYCRQKKDDKSPEIYFFISDGVWVVLDPEDIKQAFGRFDLHVSKKGGRWISCQFGKIQIYLCSDEGADKPFSLSTIMLGAL